MNIYHVRQQLKEKSIYDMSLRSGHKMPIEYTYSLAI